MRRTIAQTVIVFVMMTVVHVSCATAVPAKYFPRSEHRCKAHYVQRREHGRRTCVHVKVIKKPTSVSLTHPAANASASTPVPTITNTPATTAANLLPLPPVQMIGIGDTPGCSWSGADPTPWIEQYHPSVMRIILSPYYGAPGTTGSALPCVRQAVAEGVHVEITVQYRDTWTIQQDVDFFNSQLDLYGQYAWAVGIGNEQDLCWPAPENPVACDEPVASGVDYAHVWQALEPILAQRLPSAIRVTLEDAPWSVQYSEDAFAAGLPGAQVLADHAYPQWNASIRDFYDLARAHGLPLWCDEGLGGPGAWAGDTQTVDQMAGCQLAVTWLG